jgi:hypothetical protein
VPLTIQLQPSASQAAFNLRRWAELLADPALARLPHRIETDRHGHILMSPPPAPAHGNFQSEIAHILKSLLRTGRVITGPAIRTEPWSSTFPISRTSSGKNPKSVRNFCE